MGKEKVYRVAIIGVKRKFEDWIKNRGGVNVWNNINMSDPNAGEVFTPALTLEGDLYTKPKHTVTFAETVTDIKRFQFVERMEEVKRIKVAVRISSNGLMLKLTDGSTNKLNKALSEIGEDAYYHFENEYAVIEKAIWG